MFTPQHAIQSVHAIDIVSVWLAGAIRPQELRLFKQGKRRRVQIYILVDTRRSTDEHPGHVALRPCKVITLNLWIFLNVPPEISTTRRSKTDDLDLLCEDSSGPDQTGSRRQSYVAHTCHLNFHFRRSRAWENRYVSQKATGFILGRRAGGADSSFVHKPRLHGVPMHLGREYDARP